MNILVLGDSHTEIFQYLNKKQNTYKFDVLLVGGASARGIMQPNSRTQSFNLFSEKLQQSKGCEKVIIMLGEVDCAYLSWISSYKYNTHIDEQIKKSYTNLFSFIDNIVVNKNGFAAQQVMVAGSVLSSIADGIDRSHLYAERPNVRANQELINTKIMMYNNQLKSMCIKKGYSYFDITRHIIGTHKIVKKQFLRTDPYDHHLRLDSSHGPWLNEFSQAFVHPVKRTANAVFSIGKTASTSLFVSWASKPQNMPVLHTHDFKWFFIVDNENSVFCKNIMRKYSEFIFEIVKPKYLPPGHVQFRLNGSGIPFRDLFQAHISRFNIIGIVRNPLHRRISQFLHTLTLESLNSVISAKKVIDGTTQCPLTDPTVANIKSLDGFLDTGFHCHICRCIIREAVDNNMLMKEGRILTLFRNMFIKSALGEYVYFFNTLRNQFKVCINSDNIVKHGFHIANGDVQGIPVRCMIFKMENMNSKSVARKITEFTGINEIVHERDISIGIPLIDADLNYMKRLLRTTYDIESLYPGDTPELSLVKSFGYL